MITAVRRIFTKTKMGDALEYIPLKRRLLLSPVLSISGESLLFRKGNKTSTSEMIFYITILKIFIIFNNLWKKLYIIGFYYFLKQMF